MSHGKQFTLYTHARGPNGWKVAIVLNLLGLSYHPVYLDFAKQEQKHPDFTKYNPNGRIPALIDRNNDDFVVWESNAIILYLVEKYDIEHNYSVSSLEDKSALAQWLFFQASGQGPYYGQAFWFLFAHPEKLPSAAERYQKETLRLLGVLESVLEKQDWLVGGRLTVADTSFVTWNSYLQQVLGDEFDFEKQFPKVYGWHSRVMALPAVKEVYEERGRLIAELESRKP